MALRVLLADESTTIKKVMQLALQDFAVEVKAVPIGLDVIPVTKTFKPDLIFVDVLLTKKSGYEVCAELKSDSGTQHLPVVLMWSSFMELDEQKFQSARADGRLEKPFDADSLRQLVETLVPRTQSQPVSSYLQFPPLPEFEDKATPPAPSMAAPPALPKIEKSVETLMEEPINIDEIPMIESIDELPDYSANQVIVDSKPFDAQDMQADTFVGIPKESHTSSSISSIDAIDAHDEDEGWTRQDLTKFKIQLPKTDEDEFASKFVIPQDDLSQVQIADSENFQEITFAEPRRTSPKPSSPASETVSSHNAPSQSANLVDKEHLERIIREEARATIEAIAWRILPDIAERVIREELNKLLRDTDNAL